MIYIIQLIDYCYQTLQLWKVVTLSILYMFYTGVLNRQTIEKEVLNKLNNSIPDIKELYHKNENGFLS